MAMRYGDGCILEDSKVALRRGFGVKKRNDFCWGAHQYLILAQTSNTIGCHV